MRKKYKEINKFIKQFKRNSRQKVRFYNCWEQPMKDMWFYQFVNSRHIPTSKSIAFFSVFGPHWYVKMPCMGNTKIFETGENLHSSRYRHYNQSYLLKNYDLSLGFDYFEHDQYLRFPLWLHYICEGSADNEKIKRACEYLTDPSNTYSHKTKFASHISRHDRGNIRAKIIETISRIDKVDCDDLFLNNNNDLKEKYGDNKIDYLKNYYFNICPENSNQVGM